MDLSAAAGPAVEGETRRRPGGRWTEERGGGGWVGGGGWGLEEGRLTIVNGEWQVHLFGGAARFFFPPHRPIGAGAPVW